MLRLFTPRGVRRVNLIVTDLDRTLTNRRLRPVSSALRSLRSARRQGVETVLVSGRRWQEIAARPELSGLFDEMVLEAGAILRRHGRIVRLAHGLNVIGELANWLRAQEIPVRRGLASVSIGSRDAQRLEKFPRYAEIRPQRNHNRIDVTPHPFDKATFVGRLIAQRRSRRHALFFGDGENDVPLFRLPGYHVAVGNASPRLKRYAQEVAAGYGGSAVTRFLNERLVREGRP